MYHLLFFLFNHSFYLIYRDSPHAMSFPSISLPILPSLLLPLSDVSHPSIPQWRHNTPPTPEDNIYNHENTNIPLLLSLQLFITLLLLLLLSFLPVCLSVCLSVCVTFPVSFVVSLFLFDAFVVLFSCGFLFRVVFRFSSFVFVDFFLFAFSFYLFFFSLFC